MATMLEMLHILPLVQIENWNKYNKIYTNALSIVKDKSLEMAFLFSAEEAAEQSLEYHDEEGITNVTVSIDGTWLTRLQKS